MYMLPVKYLAVYYKHIFSIKYHSYAELSAVLEELMTVY